MINKLDDKVKEQTDYLFNQIEPYLGDFDKPDVKKILYKLNKVFYQEVEKQAIKEEREKIKKELLAIADRGELEILRNEVNNYFN